MTAPTPAYYFRDRDDDRLAAVLVGPDGWECQLGEPEDCNWSRDGRDAMDRLNAQHARIADLETLAAELIASVVGTDAQIAAWRDRAVGLDRARDLGSDDESPDAVARVDALAAVWRARVEPLIEAVRTIGLEMAALDEQEWIVVRRDLRRATERREAAIVALLAATEIKGPDHDA